MSRAPEPIAEGHLSSTPLAHVFLSIWKRGLTGTLAVWPEDGSRGQDRILFRDGDPVAARLLEPASSIELGLLPLFCRRDAPYAFYEEDLLGNAASVIRGGSATPAVVTASLRGSPPDDAMDRVLAGHEAHPLRVRGKVDDLAPIPKEQAIVDLIRAAPLPAREIIERSGDPKIARRVIYALTLFGRLGHLEDSASPPSRASGAPSASSARSAEAQRTAPPASSAQGQRAASPPSAEPSRRHRGRADDPNAPEVPPEPPGGLAPELAERWKKVAALVEAMDEYNYFQMLDIDESANDADVNAAYAARVKEIHPDRLPPELAALAPFAQRAFHQMTEAKGNLLDPDKRLAHVKAVKQGGGTPKHDRELGRIVGAAMEYQKVDVLIRRRLYDQALEIVEAVLEVSPEEADYHAKKAEILFLRCPDKKGETIDAIRHLLDRALSINDTHEGAHYTMAQLKKRLGDVEGAQQHFRAVLKANPRSIEAAREVRLYKMRRERGSGKPPGSQKGGDQGLLSKLFGGKKS